MKQAVNLLMRRLAGRKDTEHEQALVRLAVLAVIFAYLAGLAHATPAVGPAMREVLVLVAAEGLVGMGILLHILWRPDVDRARRVVGMLVDYSMMGAAMHILGEHLNAVYVVLMWVTIGNGLRYGVRFLALAVAMAAASFLGVILTTPFWQQNQPLAWGLLCGLIAIPAYLTSLLRELTRATAEARRANEAKSRFLANMSHEFRTPLNGIAGTSELLAATSLTKEQREYSDIIRTSTRSLLTLVEDVLDISVIEAGKVKRADVDFDIGEALHRIELMLAPRAREKGLRFSTELDPAVPKALHGDVDHLNQILVNLVSNAVKFTETGSVDVVARRLDAAQAESVLVEFEVRDTGIGIPESAKANLFQAFEQGDRSRTRRYGGTGLGTTIARSLTELLDGEIGFDSEEGKGATFWVRIPFAVAAASATEEPIAKEQQRVALAAPEAAANVIPFEDPFVRHRARVRPLRVLVVDDQAANVTVLGRMLEKAGHAAVVAVDGEEVLSMLECDRFDAVIVDLHMPGISGLDVLKQARVMDAGRSVTPFIVLSADATTETIRECESAGAYAYVTKPVIAERLLDALGGIALGRPAGSGEAAASAAQGRPAAVGRIAGEGEVTVEHSVIEELAALDLGDGFVSLFIGQCLADAVRCIGDAEAAAAAGRWSDLREHCHALKGVAGNMGAVSLAEAAATVMKLGDWELPQAWRNWIHQFRVRLEAARATLNLPRADAHEQAGPEN